MPNIASVLKEEIARVARKEFRRETEGLKKASAQYRSDIAALKRRVRTLEQQVSRLEKQAIVKSENAAAASAPTRVRFSAKSLAAQRKRLRLSAPNLGILLDVSPQTIYNWEAGTTRPGDLKAAQIAALRGVSKAQADARLQELAQ